ncbi:DJ-1/PfpI family protein [Ferrimicrobium sp.]|uniref:DJ-1/PfpI family protein n=1 Tax=Ferrimicrobium sp. TaxID=2926050 RepID=UPI002616232E|nr:DJ-1/PfpI family protein [Ferrimicrobium sp.]
MNQRPLQVGMVLFEDFELLDVTGPLEILGKLPEAFAITLIGQELKPTSSVQGVSIMPTAAMSEAPSVELLMVPGGMGTRRLVNDKAWIDWLGSYGRQASLVASICTGAALLARAQLLDGYRATTNKRAMEWVQEMAPNISFEPRARWVRDRDRWTSSGVAAGMDMTLALVAHLLGETQAREVASAIEYEWNDDPDHDPFAKDEDHEGLPGSQEVLTVFRSRLKPDHQDYELVADDLEQLARNQPGFRFFKTYQAQDGERCSIVVFDSEESQRAWRVNPRHLEVQRRAARDFYSEFSVQVGSLLREVKVEGSQS